MHQSGSHWLAYMLSLVMTREAGLPAPKDIEDNIIIGTPKRPPRHRLKPSIGVSHTIPSPLIRLAPVYRYMRLPRYVILVRDIRSTLVSHYERMKDNYADISGFSEYLRGDVNGKRFDKDIWWDLRFLNTWGNIHQCYPESSIVLHYESLLNETKSELIRVSRFLGIEIDDSSDAYSYAVYESTKDKMTKRERVNQDTTVVRKDNSDPKAWFDESDNEFFVDTVSRFLAYDFGYKYTK